MRRYAFLAAAALLTFTATVAAAESLADIDLSTMFSDNMVVQRDMPVPVWGTAEPGWTVCVTFADQRKTAVADAQGSWTLSLDPLAASSQPRTLSVDYVFPPGDAAGSNADDAVTLENVLVGDVWFCSGQSNMELGFGAIDNYSYELIDTAYPAIRLYPMSKAASPFPETNLSTEWEKADRFSLMSGGWNGFSAVAYLFGRKLHKELGVPIGLIQCAYGGSSIDNWIPPEEMKGDSVLAIDYLQIDKANKQYAEAKKTDPNATHPWAGITDVSRMKPAMIYNAMVCPVAPFAIKGVIWYQGETNVGEGMRYAQKMKALISGWRRVFAQPDLPFYWVQLPPWQYGGEGSLPALWEAQEACLSIPHTGMAVTVDVGDAMNIHPTAKRPVGERLALIALANAYGRTDVVSSGPVFTSMSVRNGTAVISFDHTDGGLVAKDGPLSWFAIAGADMKFVPADAAIVGNTIVVKSDRVHDPVAVRYAWSNVAHPNLYNGASLPARPFRTDK